MRLPRSLMIVCTAMAVGSAAAMLKSRPKPVTVALPVLRNVTETIAASGRLRGDTESDIGAPNGGRIAQILVREGDKVKANQLIARMDNQALLALLEQAKMSIETAHGQVASAEAAIRTASAQLTQVSRPPLTADVERLRADIDQNIRVAEAKLAGAKQRRSGMNQRFMETKNGVRSEELEQALAQVHQAESTLRQQERDLRRNQALYEKDVIAKIEVERAETNYLVTQHTLESLRARWKQLQTGTRPEQIAQAEAEHLAAQEDVAAAEATLQGARRSGEAQMRSLLSTPRAEDIAVAKQRLDQEIRAKDVARRRLEEAQVAQTLAIRRLSETEIRAPFAGTVTRIVTEIGAIAGPNAPILRLVRTGRPEIHLQLDEANLGKLQIGQVATVTNDAFPDSRFSAKVTEIGAQVDTDRGTVDVRLRPIAAPDWIRPGQTFTINIVLGGSTEQLVAPTSAIQSVGGSASLLAVEKGIVVQKTIKIGPMATQGVPVREGITRDTQIIVEPAGLQAGESVAPRLKR